LLERSRHLWLSLSWFQWVVGELDGGRPDERVLRALRSKGRIYIRLRMYEEAIPLLTRVETGLEELGINDPQILASLLQNIGIAYGQVHRHEEAIDYGERALQLIRELGDAHHIALIEAVIGSSLSSLGRFEEALDYLTSSRHGFERCGDLINLARSWHNYAELMRDWGRKEEAVAAWRMSLEIKKRTSDSVGQVNTLLSITEYFINDRDWYAALGYVTQAFPLCHQHRLYDKEVGCLELWAMILFALGRTSELEVVVTRARFLAQNDSLQSKVNVLLQKVSGYVEQLAQ